MRKIGWIDLILAMMILLSLLLTSCGTAPTPVSNPTNAPAHPDAPETISSPRLRVTNAGHTDIENLTVLFPESRIFIGDVPAGTTSEYVPALQGVYGYAAYEFDVDGTIVMQPVIDWVGASPLPGQSYTYIIELDTSRPQMQQIVLVEVKAELNND
jgi:hypothetical protein